MLRVVRGIWIVAAVALATELVAGLSETKNMARHELDDDCTLYTTYDVEVIGFETWTPQLGNTAHSFSLHFGYRANKTMVVTECNMNDTTRPEPGDRPDHETRFICDNSKAHFLWEDAGSGVLTVIGPGCTPANDGS